jgi:2-polyprenyl-3-methyl-5-hydroxy-6-metoxy-1,4-benzoquinol methylase
VNTATLREHLLATCGTGPVLVVGRAPADTVRALLAEGVHAHGVVDGAAAAGVSARARRAPLLAPRDGQSFDTLLLGDCEDWSEARVTREFDALAAGGPRQVLLDVVARDGRDRAWWEQRLFQAGLRKHPAYYLVNDYASLAWPAERMHILAERIDHAAAARFPLAALAAERDLHMDMLRETGERSDAHVFRYQWASRHVRPGDRVLDAACGLGYGGRVMAWLSEAAAITGIDGSAGAVDYARACFVPDDARLSYAQGMLPADLAAYPDASFDVVVCFETLEHVESPLALLAEFHRLLTPGGRLVASVPNDWSDASGEDPNPHHLQVYDWARLRGEIAGQFIPELAAVQTASACKVDRASHRWERRPRAFQELDPALDTLPDGEWLLVVAIKDPDSPGPAYRESVYGYSDPPGNLLAFARDYRNPWLVRAMVEFPFRARNQAALLGMAERVLAREAGSGSADEGAALAVLGYARLDDASGRGERMDSLRRYVSMHQPTAHAYRWEVSLRFLLGQCLKREDRAGEAIETLLAVAREDVAGGFSPALGTKVVEAAWEAGMLLAAAGQLVQARDAWTLGLRQAHALLQHPLSEFIGDPDFPQHFAMITALEIVDSATRCLRALRWTANGRGLPRERLFAEARQSWKWMIGERARALDVATAQVRGRDEALAAQASLLEARWNLLQAAEASALALRETADAQAAMIDARDEAIASQSALLEARWQHLCAAERAVAARDEALAATEARVRAVDAALRDTEARVAERDRALAATENALRERDTALAATEALVRERDAALAATEALVRERDDALAATQRQVRERDAALAATEAMVRERTAALASTERLVRERDIALAATEALVRSRDEAIESQARVLDERWRLLEDAAASARSAAQALADASEAAHAQQAAKSRLESTLAQLEADHAQLLQVHAELQGTLAGTQAELAELQATLRQSREDSARREDAIARFFATRRVRLLRSLGLIKSNLT